METAGGTKRSLPPVTVDDVCDFLASVLSGRAGAIHLNLASLGSVTLRLSETQLAI
jgi:hypothetical protein